MKMKYLHSKNRGDKKIFFYAIAVFIFFGVFYMWGGAVNYFLYNFGVTVSAPFWATEDYISDKLASVLINFNDKKELLEKKVYLEKQLALFKLASVENKFIREENEKLKQILGRDDLVSENKISFLRDKQVLAYVLSGPIVPPYDILVLDAGSLLGVQKGGLAVVEDGSAIGEVVEVSPNYSKVRLFSSNGQKTGVFLGENKTMIEMTGAGGGNFFIPMPKDFSVKESDLAIYPGPNFKKVAVVSRVEGKDGEMFKKVFLSATFNIKEVRFVTIIPKIN